MAGFSSTTGGLIFSYPNRGTIDYDGVMASSFATLSSHNHNRDSGVRGETITDRAILLDNNGSLEARNNADSSDVALLKLNTSDKLLMESEVTGFTVVSGANIAFRNTADSSDITVLSLDSSDRAVIGINAVTRDLIPSADGTEDLGTTSVSYQRLYVHNISFDDGANDLDDYEEGTFTPTIIGDSTAGVGGYTTQTGFYEKVGRVVHFRLLVVWTTHTGTGFMKIGGLPFTNANVGEIGCCAARPENINWDSSGFFWCTAGVIDNTTTIVVDQHRDNGTSSTIPIDTAGTWRISGSYHV